MASRLILITGANSGVGYATAQVLASASDNNHIIMAGRSFDKVKSALSEIQKAGVKGKLSALELDVTQQTSINKAAQAVEADHGRLDVLINNAGVGSRDPDVRTRFEQCFTTNVFGPAMVTAAFRLLLLKSDKPYSIYVTSGVGSLQSVAEANKGSKGGVGDAHFGLVEDAYRASKAGLNMVMLKEQSNYGDKIKVFAYCPGLVISNLRGTTEEARTGWGRAQDARISGEGMLSIIEGKRDHEAGLVLHNRNGFDGVYPW